MPLDNKCRIGPLAGAPPETCAVVISTETESGFITEDDTSPVCHTPSCPRSAKIQSTLPDVGSVVSVLADVGSSSQLRSVVSLWFLLMALDVWKEVSGVESISDVVGAEVATLLIARSSRSFVFLGRPDPPRRYTLPSVIHCCQHRATTISLRPRWRPIRLIRLLLEAYYTAPIKVRQLLVLPPVTS
ncbi:hypothetical protein TNCV_4648471 [Trichonephila clavipes]|uniref:Uncharacterized protein n=1 Tax=Trichonephila clavipes TaxID=2585209 RepID=A0A8X6SXB6_TRICX|nr:hypothetical protein TNCV_4648471 [Trichonephila clavipes]